MLLINREAQVQQLELAIVSVEQVSPGRAVLAGTPHVLPEAVERSALLCISLGIVAICILYVVFQGMDPVDFVGSLQRHRYHGHLSHLGCGVVECVIPSSQLERDGLACRGERSAQVCVAGNVFRQAHNGGKLGWSRSGGARDEVLCVFGGDAGEDDVGRCRQPTWAGTSSRYVPLKDGSRYEGRRQSDAGSDLRRRDVGFLRGVFRSSRCQNRNRRAKKSTPRGDGRTGSGFGIVGCRWALLGLLGAWLATAIRVRYCMCPRAQPSRAQPAPVAGPD